MTERDLALFHAALTQRGQELFDAAGKRKDKASPIYDERRAEKYEQQGWTLLNLAVVVALVAGLPRSRPVIELPPTRTDFDRAPGLASFATPSVPPATSPELTDEEWMAIVDTDITTIPISPSRRPHLESAYRKINRWLIDTRDPMLKGVMDFIDPKWREGT